MIRNHVEQNQKIYFVIFEILYYFVLLIISLIFVHIHGLLLINDGYPGIAHVIQKILINYGSPSPEAYALYSQRFPFFRPTYPLLMAIISSLIYVLFNIYIDVVYIGIILNVISGFIGQYYFVKLINLNYSLDADQKRILRLMYVSFPTFIVFWAMFAVDMMFLSSLVVSSYFLMKIYKNKENKMFHLQFFIVLLISISIKEESIIMLMSYIYLMIFNERRKKIILQVILWIIGVISFHVIFWERQISLSAYGYFYYHVFPFASPNKSIMIQNLPHAIYLYILQLVGYGTPYKLFFSLVFVTGVAFPILIYVKYIETRNNKLKSGKSLWNILWPWTIGYTLFMIIVQLNTISERYFLPLMIPVLLSIITLKNEEKFDNRIFYALILGNLFIILARMLFLLIFN